MPVDQLPIARRHPQYEQEHSQTEERDRPIFPGVIRRLLGHERPHQDDGDREQSPSWYPHLLRYLRANPNTSVLPAHVHGLRDDGDWYVEEEEAQRDCAPEQEGDDPVLVVPVEDQAGDPPACEEEEDEEVEGPTVLCGLALSVLTAIQSRLAHLDVEVRKRMPSGILLLRVTLELLRIWIAIDLSFLCVCYVVCGFLVCVMLLRVAPSMQVVVHRILIWDDTALKCSAFGVLDLVFAASLSIRVVVEVAVFVFMRQVEGGVVVGCHIVLCRGIVGGNPGMVVHGVCHCPALGPVESW